MMKTAIKPKFSAVLAAGAALAFAALGFAGNAQARDNVQWSVGVGVPGAVLNVGNAPVYMPAPVYMQPAPVYMQPAPVFVRPRPVYVQPQAVYLAPQPVYFEGRRGHGHGHKWRRGYDRQDYRQDYGQVYYQREGWGGKHHKNRDRDD